jgi:hypothetical protein
LNICIIIHNKIKKLIDLITECDDKNIQETYQNKISELTLKKTTLKERVSSLDNYDDLTIDWLLNFTLPLLKSPYKLRASWDTKIMQLVPSVVIWANFLYSNEIKFTTPQDSSIYADFLDKNFQKSLSLDIQRDKYNNLIEKLKSKSRLLRFMIKRDNIDISLFI